MVTATVLPGEKKPAIKKILRDAKGMPQVNLPSVGEEPPIIEESPVIEEPVSSIDVPTSVPQVTEETRPELRPPPEKKKKYFITREEAQEKINRANAASSRKEEPPPTITREQAQEKVDRANEASSNWTTTKGLQTIYAGAADLLDMPYDAFMTVVNAALTGTGLDKAIGTVQTDNIRKFAEYYGYAIPEGEMPPGVLKEALYFIGQSIAFLPASAPLLARIPAGVVDIAKKKFFGGEWPTHVNLPKSLKQLFGKDKIKTLPEGMPAKKDLTILERVNPKESIKTSLNLMSKDAGLNPISFTTREIVAGGGAGLGFGIAKEYTDSPTGQLFGGLVGGITPTVTLGLIKALGGKGLTIVWDAFRSITPMDAEKRASKRLGDIVTDKDKAIQNIEGKNTEEAILPEVQKALSPMQKTKSGSKDKRPQGYTDDRDPIIPTPEDKDVFVRNLLPLEKAILDSDPLLRQLGDKQLAELNDLIIRAMSTSTQGDIRLTKQEFKLQRGLFLEMVTARFKIAKAKADETIRKSGAKIDKQAANRIARRELDSALDDMKNQEDEIWALVDDTSTIQQGTGKHFESAGGMDFVEVITNPLINAWRTLLKEKTRVDDPGDFLFTGRGSKDLYKELGSYDGKGNWIKGSMKQNETLKILQVLRSRMLEELRGEKSKLNSGNKRRIFGKLQNAILKMFEAEEHTINMKINPNTGEFTATQPERQLLKALSVSRMLNDKFNKGEIAKILGSSRDGSFKTEEALTLKNLIGKGLDPETRALNLEKLFKAIERERTTDLELPKTAGDIDSDPLSIAPVTEAVKAYIKHEFFKNFVFDGEVTRKSAMKWMTDNRDTLKQIPGLKKELTSVIETGKTAALMESRYKTINNLLHDPQRSMAIYLVEHDPLALYNRVGKFTHLTERQFNQSIDKMLSKASRDKSGDATEGIQQSVFDWVLGKSYLTGGEGSKAISATEQSFFSGFQMGRILTDPKNKYIFDNVLTPDQQTRLELIYRTAKEVDAIRLTTGFKEDDIMTDTPGWILQMLGKVGGAGFGRWFQKKFMGGGTVQTPGAFSSRFGAIMKDMTHDYGKQMLIKAATSEDPALLIALLQRIKNPVDEQQVSKQLNAYIATLLAEDNIPFPKEDFYGNIEQETTEPQQ